MNLPEPATDGHFCRRCGVHRTRTASALCPTCLDEDRHTDERERKAS